MKAIIFKNGVEKTYLINHFEISNYNEPYITLFVKPFKDLLKDTINIALKDLQEVLIKEDEENDSSRT